MIPLFAADGRLPPGIHEASSWDEFVQRYGGNAHRLWLLGGLKRALQALRMAGCLTVYVDGSFVTDKETPADFDACWDAMGVRLALLDPVLMEFSNQRAAQKVKFFGECFPAHAVPDWTNPFATYLNFFQIDKDTGSLKGIVALGAPIMATI